MNLLEMAEAQGIQGFMHPNELERLAELAIGRDVLEVGSFRGLSAFCMAITARSLMCIDTFRANTAGQVQQEELTTLNDFLRATGKFRCVDHRVCTSEGGDKQLHGWTFDLVFLDAMHTYEDVLADITRWWPRIRPGGVLALHDYGHDHFPGVKKAADEIFGPAPEGTTVVTLRWIQK